MTKKNENKQNYLQTWCECKIVNEKPTFPIWCEYNDNAKLLYMIKQKISEIAYLYNYKTHDSPILTNIDWYSWCGGWRDGMMSVVTDAGGVVALRSDLTGQFNKHMNNIAKQWWKWPWKRLDIGKVFRNEKKINVWTKREFYQMDLDVADIDLPIEYDIESISCLYEWLKSIFQLLDVDKKVTVQLNNTNLIKSLIRSVWVDPESKRIENNKGKTYFEEFLWLLDKYYKSENKHLFYKEFSKGLRDVFDIKDETIINNLISILEKLWNEKENIIGIIKNEKCFKDNNNIGINEIETVYNWLLDNGVSVVYNPFIARKWYDWTIFETLIDNDIESLWKSVCSWWRYIIDGENNLIWVWGSIWATRLLDFLWNYISDNETITTYPWINWIKTNSWKKIVDLMRSKWFSVEQIYKDNDQKKEKIVFDSKNWILDVLLNFSFDTKKIDDEKYISIIEDIQTLIKKYNKDFVVKNNKNKGVENSLEIYNKEPIFNTNIEIDESTKEKLSSIDWIEKIIFKSDKKEILKDAKDVRVFLCPLYDENNWISIWENVPELYAKKLEKSQDVMENLDLTWKTLNYIFADTGLLVNLDNDKKDAILSNNIENYKKLISKKNSDFNILNSSDLVGKENQNVNINNTYTIEDIIYLLKEFWIDYYDNKIRDVVDVLVAKFWTYTKVYVLIYNYLRESKFFYDSKPNSIIVLPEKVWALIDLYDLANENCTKNSLLIWINV
jgi:hypothetical protein